MKHRLMPPLLAALALATLPAYAAPTRIVTSQPPPELVQGETTPAEREGYVWAPGYWNYRASKFEWTKGHWVPARKGYKYVAPRWNQENGQWTLYQEDWVKDEDNKEKTVMKDSTSAPLR